MPLRSSGLCHSRVQSPSPSLFPQPASGQRAALDTSLALCLETDLSQASSKVELLGGAVGGWGVRGRNWKNLKKLCVGVGFPLKPKLRWERMGCGEEPREGLPGARGEVGPDRAGLGWKRNPRSQKFFRRAGALALALRHSRSRLISEQAAWGSGAPA